MKRHILLPIIGCAILCTGCIGTHYTNTEAPSTLKYLYEESEQNLSNLSKRYGSTLNKIVKEGVPMPGACADYAVTLAKLNRAEDANKWLNNEARFYPSAIPYVNYLKKTMIPQFANDTIAYTLEDLRKQTMIEIKEKPVADSTAPKKTILERAQDSWKNVNSNMEKKKEQRAKAKAEKENKAKVAKNEDNNQLKAKDENKGKANSKIKEKQKKPSKK